MPKSEYISSYFPNGENENLKEGVNYTEETLNYMTPFVKAARLAQNISRYFKVKTIIDACAGIGGNTLGFMLNDDIEKVISYELRRDRWTMLCNNIAHYHKQDKATAYNQTFSINEDLWLSDLDKENPQKETVVYFDPPWLPAGASTDKLNYILSGIKINNKSLETWCHQLCKRGYLGVVMHLPPNYELILPGKIVDDSSSNKARLIYYTLDNEIVDRLTKGLSLIQQNQPIVKDVTDEVSSHEKELERIPGPLVVKGPKVILQTHLTPDFPRRRYFREAANPKAIHIGQRKLLLSEIEFLTRTLTFSKKNYTVLYIGSAPGQHIPILSEMFPEVSFVLYDPSHFAIKETSKIKIHQKLFDSTEAMKYTSEKDLLLVSDIRSAPRKNYRKGEDVDHEFEKEVAKNLEQQKDWVLRLRPTRSLLKFRLPFEAKETEYFDGIIFFQAYPPAQSAETRLEVSPTSKMIKYDNLKYEQQMFYFNTQYRTQSFQNYNKRYGWSYDTIREFFILKKYLSLRGLGDNEISKWIEKFDTLSKDEKKIKQILDGFETVPKEIKIKE